MRLSKQRRRLSTDIAQERLECYNSVVRRNLSGADRGLSVMQHFVEILRKRWSSEGIAVPPGASEEQLAAFENRNRIRLPHDMQLFYSMVDGMGRGDVMDSELIMFYNLGSILPSASNIDQAHLATCKLLYQCYTFGSHSCGLPSFCVNVFDGPKYGHVGGYYDQKEIRYFEIGNSFSSFVELYVGNQLDRFC